MEAPMISTPAPSRSRTTTQQQTYDRGPAPEKDGEDFFTGFSLTLEDGRMVRGQVRLRVKVGRGLRSDLWDHAASTCAV
jgi:hypothetical protein